MPPNAVKTARDEHLWARAKEQAKKQGHTKDYQYIMGIYQRMSGEKSMTALLAGGADELRKAGGEGSRGGKVIGHTSSGKPIYQTHSGDHPSYTHSKTKAKLGAVEGKTKLGHEHEAPKLIQHGGKHHVKVAHNSDTGSVAYHEYDPGKHLIDPKKGTAIHAYKLDDKYARGSRAGGDLFQTYGLYADLPKEIKDPTHGRLRIRGHNSDTGTAVYHQADKNPGWERSKKSIDDVDDLRKGDEQSRGYDRAAKRHARLAQDHRTASPKGGNQMGRWRQERAHDDAQAAHQEAAEADKEAVSNTSARDTADDANDAANTQPGADEVKSMRKSGSGPFMGPRGGMWADPKHTIPYKAAAGAPKGKRKASHKAHAIHHQARALAAVNAADSGMADAHLSAASAHQQAARTGVLEHGGRAHQLTERASGAQPKAERERYQRMKVMHESRVADHKHIADRLRDSALDAKRLGISSAAERLAREHGDAAALHGHAAKRYGSGHAKADEHGKVAVEQTKVAYGDVNAKPPKPPAPDNKSVLGGGLPYPEASKEVAEHHTASWEYHNEQAAHALSQGFKKDAMMHALAARLHGEARDFHGDKHDDAGYRTTLAHDATRAAEEQEGPGGKPETLTREEKAAAATPAGDSPEAAKRLFAQGLATPGAKGRALATQADEMEQRLQAHMAKPPTKLTLTGTIKSVFDTDLYEVEADPEGHGLSAEESADYTLLKRAIRGSKLTVPKDPQLADRVARLLTDLSNTYDDTAERSKGRDKTWATRASAALAALAGKVRADAADGGGVPTAVPSGYSVRSMPDEDFPGEDWVAVHPHGFVLSRGPNRQHAIDAARHAAANKPANKIGHTSKGDPVYGSRNNPPKRYSEAAHRAQAEIHRKLATELAGKDTMAAAESHLVAYRAHLAAEKGLAHRSLSAGDLATLAHDATALTKAVPAKENTMKSLDVIEEMDKLIKAASPGQIIGRTADGKEVYAHDQNTLQKQAPGAVKKSPTQPGAAAAATQKPAPGAAKKPDEEDEENGVGTTDHHKERALAHLQAAQAHASAAGSAKKVEEAKEHKGTVQAAQSASEATMDPTEVKKSAVLIKNNLQISMTAEDQVLDHMEKGGVIGGQGAGLREDGRSRLLGQRQERLQKATIYQGEHDAGGSRGADMRETVARAQALGEMVELDEANNRGQGGLPDWFADAWGKLSPEEQMQARAPMGGPVATGWQKGIGANEEITVLDDDNPYTRAMYRGGQHGEHQSAIRLAYQGGGRENPK